MKIGTVLFLLFPAIAILGCSRCPFERENMRLLERRRLATDILNELKNLDYSRPENAWPEAASRLVSHRLADVVAGELALRAVEPGDPGLRRMLIKLTEYVVQSGTRHYLFPMQLVESRLARLFEDTHGPSDLENVRLLRDLHWLFPTREGSRFFLALLKDPDPEIRKCAIIALEYSLNLRIPAAEEIVKLLYDEDRDVAMHAASRLKHHRHPHVAIMLREQAETINDRELRRIALDSAEYIERTTQWPEMPQ